MKVDDHVGAKKTNRDFIGLLVKSEDAAAHSAFGSLFVFELSSHE
jgi:hypothetical protein